METVLPLPLPTPTQPNPPPRPRLNDDAVLRATVEAMLPDVVEWMGDDWRESERALVIEQLMDVIEFRRDGYDRAKRLEDRHSWSCDSALVEILEAHDGTSEVWAATKAWVAANGIAPRLAIGAHVRFRRGAAEQTGVIVNIDPDRAWYVVRTAEFLAKHPDQAKHPTGHCVAFEDCTAANPVSTA